MKKSSLILSIFVAFTLLLPAGGFSIASSSANQTVQSSAFEIQKVFVVPLVQVQTVVAENAMPLNAQSCSLKTEVSGTLQNTAAVNLNQPASCFNFVAKQIAAQPELRVSFVQQYGTIVVPSTNRFSEAPSLMPAPLASDRALPTIIFLLLGIVLYEERKLIKSSIFKKVCSVKGSLVLGHFQVLRC